MVPALNDGPTVLALLKRGHELYRATNGEWHLTYRVGAVSESAALWVQEQPGVVPSSSNSYDMWCFGKTMDYARTVSARNARQITRGQVVYADGSVGPPPSKPFSHPTRPSTAPAVYTKEGEQ